MTEIINGTTGISGVAGSASTPALVGSDADSGYYINSANEPNASVNGTSVWSAASSFGFKNRIINGAMVIDQRNAGASVTPASAGSGTYTLDRWNNYATQASKYTVQQNAGSVAPPAGFTNYAGMTSSSAYSITSTDIFLFRQSIEGYNAADLAWGTANAQAVTLSFWVRSSLTGTFGGSFINADQNRSYPFTYTINSANTWEQKTITVAGDTSGTWGKTNGIGIGVYFGLGVGSTYSGTAGSWASTNYYSATGATSVVGTNGATFYITGVQLEKGSTATSFDFRSYGTEFQLCQRYYYRIQESTFSRLGVVPNTTTNREAPMFFPVTMRSAPTVTVTGSSFYLFSTGVASTGGGSSTTGATVQGCFQVSTGHAAATAGDTCAVDSSLIQASAEL